MSSASGVTASDECMELFQELKLKKKYKYILFKISEENNEVIPDRVVEESTYDDFKKVLTEELAQEPRYAVYDFDYEKPGEGQRNKIVFFSWIPDNTHKLKHKMLYASSKDAIRKRLVGVAIEVQGTDADEVDYAAVLEKVTRSN